MGTSSFISGITDITILSGATSSRVVDCKSECADASIMVFQAPATLAETCTFQVSKDGITFVALHDGTADIVPPLAGKGRWYAELIGWQYFKILAGGAVAADRTWKVDKQWTI